MGNSSFVWRNYQQNGSKEPAPHAKARLTVGNVIRSVNKIPIYNKEIQLADDWRVYPDIFIESDQIAVELDGNSHNTTERRHDKDISRDKALSEKGIRTVRIQVEDVNGKRLKSGSFFRLTTAEIYAMIFRSA